MKLHRIPLALLVLLLAAAGCSDQGEDLTGPADDDDDDPPPAAVSYADDIQPIWDSTCVGCHGAFANAGLDLRSPGSYARLVGVSSTEVDMDLVTPDDPAMSWLYLKIAGLQTFGSRMPEGGELPQAQIDLVREWIEEGAPNN